MIETLLSGQLFVDEPTANCSKAKFCINFDRLSDIDLILTAFQQLNGISGRIGMLIKKIRQKVCEFESKNWKIFLWIQKTSFVFLSL